MIFIGYYIMIGLIWAGWLEWFTCNNLEEPYNQDWQVFERVFHVCLWPVSLSIFLYHIIKDCLK